MFDSSKFVMNDQYLFVWNTNEIKYHSLDERITDKHFKKMDFTFSSSNDSKVKQVVVGSNPSLCVIILDHLDKYGKNFFTVFVWNIDTDSEEESWDVEGEFRLLWDSSGNPYIITKDKVIFTAKKCVITAFDLKNFKEVTD
jgi:hypothetical protein